MITILFPESDSILSFDGSVLEGFYPDSDSQRVHIHHVESIEIVTDRQGKRLLEIGTSLNNPIPQFYFGAQLDAMVNDLVAQVKQALCASRRAN